MTDTGAKIIDLFDALKRSMGPRIVGAAGAGLCAYCLKPVEGNHGIHRDGFGVGPQVDLCDACGSDVSPTCAQIWDRIAQPAEGEFAHRKSEQ